VFSGFLGADPKSPAESPILLTVLSWARRELSPAMTGRPAAITQTSSTEGEITTFAALTAANQGPVAGTPTVGSPNPTTGAVGGSLNFTDADHDQLTYTPAAVDPAKGTLVVNTDGTYTYTPTVADRIRSATTNGTHTQLVTVSASDGQASTDVTFTVPIDPAYYKPTKTIDVEDQPDEVAISPDGSKAYVLNHVPSVVPGRPWDGVVTVIDTNTGDVGGDIPVGGILTDVEFSPNKPEAYVVGQSWSGDRSVAVINTTTNTVVSTIELDDGEFPGAVSGMGISPDGSTIYVAQHQGDKVWVIDTTTRTVTETFQVPGQPVEIAVSRDGTRAYAATAGTQSVAVIDTASKSVVTTIPVGANPQDIAVSADGARAYAAVSGGGGGGLTVIDTTTNTAIYTQTTGEWNVAVVPDGSVALTSNNGSGLLVSQWDTGTRSLLGKVSPGYYPQGLDVTPDGRKVFVTNLADGTVSMFTLTHGTNRPPVAGIPSFGTPNQSTGAVVVSPNFSDPEGGNLTYTIDSDPTKGTFTPNPDGIFTYTPFDAARHPAAAQNAPEEDVADFVFVTAYDVDGNSTSTLIRVPITPKNTAPTGSASYGNPNANAVVTGSVAGADADSDPITYTVTTNPSKGSVVVNGNGTFTYTPTAAARHAAAATNATSGQKQDTFVVTISDGHGGTKALTITPQIAPKNSPPTGTPSSDAPNTSNGAVNGTVGGADADNDALTYTVTSNPAKGSVTLNANGTFTYKPTSTARSKAASSSATPADKQDTFVVTVRDGYGGTTPVTVTVPISPAQPNLLGSLLGGVLGAVGSILGI
jgi:YVTN family beta-propeller protein/VCBS repeat-containing protein